jgi:sigma-B regulation protein RsbU (phosphoserine phosphatase)
VEGDFSLIRIEQQLRSFIELTRCAAIVFESNTMIYVFKKDPSQLISMEVFKVESGWNWAGFLKRYSVQKMIPLPSGKLIFADPSTTIAGWLLEFLARQLEDSIQFASVIDTVFQASVTISSNLNLSPLLHKIMSLSEEVLGPEVSAIMLIDWGKRELYWEISRGEKSHYFHEKVTLPLDHGIGGYVARTGESVLINDVQKDPRFDHSYDEKCGFCTRSMICVPVKFHGETLGVIEVINKEKGAFTSMDLRLLEIIAAQAGSAIQNARLFKEAIEKQRMERELAIARDLQVSMLPVSCPTLKGFEIAAYSIPAEEVGGDFYDFVEIAGQSIGVVIGDVTGKSVSGALVMAASRSVFRMLSEEALSVGEIMGRANRRIKKDIKSGMNVGLIYAVIDGYEKAISLSSGGQMQPIHYRSETGKAHLVQTKGDKFPLGIMEESEYLETRLNLQSGDKVIFYTDGIVEAMNEGEEIFGFERLLDVVERAGSASSDEVLKSVLQGVRAFAGQAPQYDDMTIIVVSADHVD